MFPNTELNPSDPACEVKILWNGVKDVLELSIFILPPSPIPVDVPPLPTVIETGVFAVTEYDEL